MSNKRKQYSASFKPKVALAALMRDQATSEIVACLQSQPIITMVSLSRQCELFKRSR